MINFQTLIATKAARVVLAARGEPVLEFGLRRAQGIDGGLSGQPGGLRRRLRGHLERAGRQAVRHPREGHARPQLGDVLRRRAGGLPRLRRGHAQQLRVPGRHLRHAGGRAARGRGRPVAAPPGARDGGHPPRLGRPGLPEHRGPADPRRRRLSRRRDRRLQRPGRADHREPQGAGGDDRRLGRGHAAGHRLRRAGPGRRLQALRGPRAAAAPGRIASSSPSRRSRSPLPGMLQVRRLFSPQGQAVGDAIYDAAAARSRATARSSIRWTPTRRKTIAAGTPGEDLLVPVFRGGRRVYPRRRRWRRSGAGRRSSWRRFTRA